MKKIYHKKYKTKCKRNYRKKSYKKQYGGYKYKELNTKTRKIFNLLDKDNNGVINIHEFNSGLKKITKHKISSKKQLFKHFDKNNDGVINYNEFKEGIKSIKNRSNKGLHKRFRKHLQK